MIGQISLRESALLVVDAQKGFTELCPNELPVPGALEITPKINRLLSLPWRRMDASLDWHPPDHCSFLGQRDNLWPPHCVMNTPGADFLPGLHTERFHTVWRKAYHSDREAYSVNAQHPGYPDLLRAEGVRTVAVCGIATNICCYYEAKDLRQSGFEVYIVEDASAGIDVPAAGFIQARTKAEGQALGIHYAMTNDILTAAQ